MSPCPRSESLQGLLDEFLEGPELEEIVIHIEICVSCQEVLEDLTRGLGWKSTMPELSGVPKLDFEQEIEEFDLAGRSANSLPGDISSADSARTLTQSEPLGTSPGSEPGSARTDWPTVPGYEILDRLGEGGMGIVYRARHLGLNRLEALKMIRGGSRARPDLLARFPIEAEIIAGLRHANILQIYHIGEVDHLPFVSLELLEGGSLADRIKGTPQPGLPSAELLVILAQAIHAAHQAGIVHRDLKPSNVLFTTGGVPKISDFGLAKRMESDSRQTESGAIMGSPSYMAPEQARGHTKNVGPAADVYALGAILYEMLTGRPPFKGETPIETVHQVIDDEPVPPSRLVPRLSADLETISLKCLNKEAHKRYGSAQALADDLERYIEGKPIKARPTPFWERGAKWSRRRPVKALSLFLGTAAALLAIGSVVVYDRFRVQQDAVARETNTKTFFEAQAKASTDPVAARTDLVVLRSMMKAHPTNQHNLDARAHRLIEQIDEREARERSQMKNQARLAEFFRGKQAAFTQDTQFTGLDYSRSHEATRKAALAALAVFASTASSDSWALEVLPASFSDQEKAQVSEGCYELLLVLADSLDKPAESLRLLDQAALLRAPDKTYHLRRASYLAKTGNAPAAEAEQRAADATPPSSPVDHFLAGWDQFKRRDFASANRHFDLTLQRQSDHFWARCLSALCSLQLKQGLLAKERLTGCIRSEPDDPWLYIWRALASMQVAVATEKEETDHQFQHALDDFGQVTLMLAQKPDNLLRWVLLVNRGNLFVQHAEWEKAFADFHAAAGLDSQRTDAFVGLGMVYKRQHRLNEASEQFTRAIALQPETAALYRARAEVELARDDPTPAQSATGLSDLDQAIRLESPANLVLALDHTRRAKLLHDAHRLPEALSACEAALKVDRDRNDAHLLRIQVLLDLKRYDEVTRSCDALLAKDKPSAAIYELRGLARSDLKDFAGAIEDHTQAIALEPGRALLFLRRGDLYLVSDAPKLAKHDFDEAIRLDPSNSDAVSGRAAVLVRLGQHREAVEDTERALRLSVPTGLRLFSAARIYARAAAVVAASVRSRPRESVNMVEQYQERGTSLLREAVNKAPANERAAFWRDVVQSDPDPAMNALRRRLRASDWNAQASVSPGGRHDQP